MSHFVALLVKRWQNTRSKMISTPQVANNNKISSPYCETGSSLESSHLHELPIQEEVRP